LIFFCGDFAELFSGGFEVFDSSDAAHDMAVDLAPGRPERSKSRDDDFLGENVGIGKIVRIFEAFVAEPEDIKSGFGGVRSLIHLFNRTPILSPGGERHHAIPSGINP